VTIYWYNDASERDTNTKERTMKMTVEGKVLTVIAINEWRDIHKAPILTLRDQTGLEYTYQDLGHLRSTNSDSQ
jgi:hypothetical protein